MQTINNRMTETQIADLFSLAVQLQVKAEESEDRDTAILAYSIQNACSNLTESRREFWAADATINNLELKLTDTAVQLANAESKCRELAAENAALKDAIGKHADSYIMCGYCRTERDGKNDDVCEVLDSTPATDDFLAEVRAQARKEGAHFVANRMLAAWDAGFIDDTAKNAADIARMILTSTEFMADAPEGDFDRSFADGVLEDISAQLRKGAAL
ncbi:TPA: Eae-like protein [Citrobacter freundii]